MENLKIKVKNEAESREAQELFFEFGCYWSGGKNKDNVIEGIGGYYIFSRRGEMTYCEPSEVELNGVGFNLKEITMQQLKDIVILKRNSIEDATHYCGGSKYYLTTTESFEFINGVWVNIDEYADSVCFVPINKESEVKMEEYLALQEDGIYKLVMRGKNCSSTDIKVPEGSEIAVEGGFNKDITFYKDNGECQFDKKWITCNVEDKNGLIHVNLKTLLNWGEGNKIVWQRSDINKDIDKGLSTQDKLKFIEKWLNGEKIQYILGIENDKTQADKSKWHNFTEGAMQYIKRPDIKFREAPKYVTINGIEFKSVEKLLKYVKNNFDLEDGE